MLRFRDAVLAVAAIWAASSLASAQDLTAVESLAERLRRDPHPQFGAANWDMLDYPQQPVGSLKLEDARNPGTPVEIDKILAGRIAVLVEIDPKARHGNWVAKEGIPPAVRAYRRAYEEYSPRGVKFLAVWGNSGKVKTADREAFLTDAASYADKHDLPGRIFVDSPGDEGQRRSAYYTFVNARIPGHPPSAVTCVLNTDGAIVYRGTEKQLGFAYHVTRLILDRLLDKDFDAAVRREFYPDKPRELPTIDQRAEGLVYVDDFESYEDNHRFKLEPRWGFRYATQARLDIRPSIAEASGRGRTQAVLIHGGTSINCVSYGLSHQLPAPLTNGHVRFHVRRRAARVYEQPLAANDDLASPMHRFQRPRRALCVRFDQPGTYEPAGFLFATGDWEAETFVPDFRVDRTGPVMFSKEGWHEIMVVCRSGQKAELLVDGQRIAELKSETIGRVGFRVFEANKQFYVDDVEILYRGDAKALLTHHRALRPVQIGPVKPFTPTEQGELTRAYTPVGCGAQRAELPLRSIPRADVVSVWKGPSMTFDHPVKVDDLVLDDLRHPGRLLNVTEKYKGKIVWIMKAHKGDHFGEGHLRKRTANRNYTVFNRSVKLAEQYREKGVVIIGVAAPESGHRDESTTFDDRVGTGFEGVWVTEAMMDEAGLKSEETVFGIFPEMLDEMVGERLTNHLRIWNRSFRGRLVDGQFAGFGPDAILNRDGKIVFRGAGPDGQGYWKQRAMLDRLLDADFDAAYRQEFRNPDLPYHRSPVFPNVEKRPDGLAYVDDFESYEDSYDFRLQPRWGFAYEKIDDQHFAFGGTIEPDQGRSGSQAVTMTGMAQADVLHPNRRWSWATHKFPAPLRHGHIRLFVRRGPKVKWFGQPPLCRIYVSVFDEGGKRLTGLTTTSEWKDERFMLARPLEEFAEDAKIRHGLARHTQGLPFELAPYWSEAGAPSDVAMAKDDWQEVRFTCRPGANVQVTVDSRLIGEFNTDSLSSLEIRGETFSATWVDDVELFYAGHADDLATKHKAALTADLTRRQNKWKTEAEAWDAEVTSRRTTR